MLRTQRDNFSVDFIPYLRKRLWVRLFSKKIMGAQENHEKYLFLYDPLKDTFKMTDKRICEASGLATKIFYHEKNVIFVQYQALSNRNNHLIPSSLQHFGTNYQNYFFCISKVL